MELTYNANFGLKQVEDDIDFGEDDSSYHTDYQQYELVDPCEKFQCPRGKVCEVNEKYRPVCVCQDPTTCPLSTSLSERVCGTDNKTYDNPCLLFTTQCALERTKQGHRLHLDYTGPCRYVAPCQDKELVQFSRQIHDWLKNTVVHLYEYDIQNPGSLTRKHRKIVKKIYEIHKHLKAGNKASHLLSNNFEVNYLLNVYPVHWQFGQLDQKPADGYLTHSELAPLRGLLAPVDHCASRFFDECDSNKDKNISLTEWCSCFGLKDGGEKSLSR
ncbi:SPARC [Latimeria chalumnae]|uniref:SPARC n=1 Tax=Latimeria chalumnae TaxID=7897 RepID=UPI00313DA1A9